MVAEMDRPKCGDCGAFIQKEGEDGLKGKGTCWDFKISGIHETHATSYAAIINRFRRRTCFRPCFNPQPTLDKLLQELANQKLI